MFNQAYGAGYRAGMTERDGEAVCPYPPHRFLSCAAWRNGLNDGVLKRRFNSEPFFKSQMTFEVLFIGVVIAIVIFLHMA